MTPHKTPSPAPASLPGARASPRGAGVARCRYPGTGLPQNRVLLPGWAEPARAPSHWELRPGAPLAPRLQQRRGPEASRWEAGAPGQEEPQHSCHPSLASHHGKHLERVGAVAAGHVGLSGASTGFTTALPCPSALPGHRGGSTSHLHCDAGSGGGLQPDSPQVSSLDLQCVFRDCLWQEAASPTSGG